MKKPIDPKTHGVMDYLFGVFVLLAPAIFHFHGLPANLLYVLGIGHLLMSGMTAYPLGITKTIPFTVHSKIEAAAAAFMLASPWLFRFSALEAARNVYVAAGAVVLVLWSLTDYRSMWRGSLTDIFPEEYRKAA
ncbi:MAG TPA: hypothetical protein VL688_06955 [Verrucomicrobiae bacterium]|nr:hypothetical protein [Verrucomicrobiae bacterium]